MIKSSEKLPEFIEGKDYSRKVWGVCNGSIGVFERVFMDGDGWFWANCYGDVFGDSMLDDDYPVSHWQYINIPEPPK